MKTTIEFIKLTILTVGGALAILLLTGVASFANEFESYVIPQEDLNKFHALPKEHKIQSCGFQQYNHNVLNSSYYSMSDRIEGYNSRMDNWNVVHGAGSQNASEAFAEAVTFALVVQDDELTEKIFQKLYKWADEGALLGTTSCYNRNPNDKIKAHCEGEWSDKNGQDLAPIKDATASLEIAHAMMGSYYVLLADYKPNDPRHDTIKKYFKQWNKRFPLVDKFYWGNLIGWSLPNITIKWSQDKSYKGLVKNMIKGADRWILKDGSMKNRTTRGNRALWYHFTAINEAFLAMEIARAAGVKLPKNYEKELLLAVELWHKAYLDNSYITPWAKKAHNSQFDKNNPHYQKFNNKLSTQKRDSWWMFAMQYRYPDHPTSKFLADKLSKRMYNQVTKVDPLLGFGAGCVYAALTDAK